mgnify:CR=1 FL=1
MLLPVAERKQLDNMVKYEIEQYLPIVANVYVIEYSVAGEVIEDGVSKYRVQVAAMPQNMVENFANLLSECGLKTVALDLHFNAVAKLFFQKVSIEDKTVAREPIELNIESMSIQAPLLGKYDEIMNFISRLEELNRTTVVNSLQLIQGTDGNISGSIGLDFYAMNKLTEDPQDESYLDWPYDTPKDIDNPFPFAPTDSPDTEEPPVEETSGGEANGEVTETLAAG